ncbi:MAG TPA: phospholipase D-like domain-containing protein [Gammaproteobacteria bacterium]
MQTPQLIGTAVAALGLALGLAASIHALLYKRLPQSAFGWIAVCMSLPFAGALLYYLFGINRVERRARALRSARRTPAAPPDDAAAPPGSESMAALGAAVSGRPLVGGNRVVPLHNGEQAFPAMLEAIAGAAARVYLSTYIFEGNRTGRQFVDALGAAAARGVDVRVLLDGVGELYSRPRASELLARAGVRHARFVPPKLLPPELHVNLRNHRKILAVDGRVGFTGGMNIGDRHLAADTANPRRVVDLHFRLEGPVVAQMEGVFLDDWEFVTGDRAEPPAAPAAAPAANGALCRVVADGPDGDLDRLRALLVGAIGAARRRVAIMTPYFLPPREVTGALQAAALRGVDVAVVLPAKNNLPYIHWATRHALWELLQRGVQVLYQPPPFVHSKLLLVDDHYALIGSANIDARSLRLNFELDVEVYDWALVADLDRHFTAVRARSTPVTLADVDARPLPRRLLDGVAWLFSPYL